MKERGRLTVEALRKAVEKEHIETVVVAFTDHYGRLMGKRFDADFFLASMAEGTHACDYLLTTDMEMEPVPGYEFASWELGYGDFHLVPDFSTLRQADWLERTALVLCHLHDRSENRVAVAPRSILKEQVEKLQADGFTSFAASELEYYAFNTSYEEARQGSYRDQKPAGWYLEDYHILQGSRTETFTAAARKHLKNSAVPVENSKGEWGLGQHELNVRYAEILEMADRHVVYKQCLKELADKMGLSVTFMAKYKTEQAGSSCHIHISLWRNGKNAFVGDEDFGRVNTERLKGEPAKNDRVEGGQVEGRKAKGEQTKAEQTKTGPLKVSKVFKHFLGGWLKYVPDVMVFYAPTVNSYKRFVDGSWAPTRIAWSADNRTAGFRVVGSGSALRIECRIPGADCNPYLAFAAALASGLKGLQDEIMPPECFAGDIYEARHLPHVPKTLKEARDLFAASAFAEQAFGREVVAHYAHFYAQEVEAFEKAVTDWEHRRYFERI